jgi:hypothetical protein
LCIFPDSHFEHLNFYVMRSKQSFDKYDDTRQRSSRQQNSDSHQSYLNTDPGIGPWEEDPNYDQQRQEGVYWGDDRERGRRGMREISAYSDEFQGTNQPNNGEFSQDFRGQGTSETEEGMRRRRRGFGGASKSGNQQNWLNQQNTMHRPGSNRTFPEDRRQGRFNEGMGFGAGSHINQVRQRRRGFGGASDISYGENYGQGYYGHSDNQGWAKGDNRQNNRNRNQQEGDRSQQQGNPNTRGEYGSSNYSNLPNRRSGGTDYNSTNRYYSRTRDNDPFV